MSLNNGNYDVYAGEANVGTLSVSANGLMTVIECDCKIVSDDILRLAAVTERGVVLLGVMMPTGGSLHFKKSYSKNALAQLGLEDVSSFAVFSGNASIERPAFAPQPVPPPEEEYVPEPAPTPNQAVMPAPEPEPEPSPEPDPVQMPAPAVEGVQDMGNNEGWEPISNPSNLFTDKDIADVCERVRGAFTLNRDGITMLAVPVQSNEPFPMMPIFCFGHNQTIAGREYIVFKIREGKLLL